MYIIDFAPATELIKADRIRGIAVTGMERYPLFPEIPTFSELGYPLTLVGTNGFLAPASTPQSIGGGSTATSFLYQFVEAWSNGSAAPPGCA